MHVIVPTGKSLKIHRIHRNDRWEWKMYKLLCILNILAAAGSSAFNRFISYYITNNESLPVPSDASFEFHFMSKLNTSIRKKLSHTWFEPFNWLLNFCIKTINPLISFNSIYKWLKTIHASVVCVSQWYQNISKPFSFQIKFDIFFSNHRFA